MAVSFLMVWALPGAATKSRPNAAKVSLVERNLRHLCRAFFSVIVHAACELETGSKRF
jgi:hypothetical protein